MQMILRHFESDGLAAILDLGFVPDLVKVHLSDDTNVDIITWFKRMFDDETGWGTVFTGSSGVTTVAASAAAGILEYDSVASKQMLPAPSGTGEAAATLPVPFVAGTAQPTARTTSVVGTVVKSSNSQEKGFVYECTVSAGVYGTEPTAWPTIPGQTISDGTNTWICRESKIKNVGVKGITIGASVINNDNGNQIYVEAYRADKDPADLDAADVVADSAL